MKTLDGNVIAQRKLKAVRKNIVAQNTTPALAVVLVGHDPASELYVKLKEKAAKKVGVELRRYLFEADTSRDELATCVDFLNHDEDTHGIIVQLPLPEHLDPDEVVNLITADKDVDGFHAENQKNFLAGENSIYPVFPGAIMALIHDACADVKGKHAVVVGKSDVFDRVMSHALERENVKAEFIQLKSDMKKLSPAHKKQIKNADIVVTALGRADFFSGEDFKGDAIVIDGGISRVNDETVGDVDQLSCIETEITLSPVPGGVGPVTIACLLENVSLL